MFIRMLLMLLMFSSLLSYGQDNIITNCCLEKTVQLDDSLSLFNTHNVIECITYSNSDNYRELNEIKKANLISFLNTSQLVRNLTCITFEQCKIDSSIITPLIKLKTLESLIFKDVDITFQIDLHELTNLKSLIIERTDIKQFNFYDIRRLELIKITGVKNQTAFLDKLCTAKKLKYIIIPFNLYNIEDIPECICELPNVSYLYLEGTYIKQLPRNIGKMKALRFLNIRKTEIENLPESIYNLKDLNLVLSGGCDNLYEAITFDTLMDIMNKKPKSWNIIVAHEN